MFPSQYHHLTRVSVLCTERAAGELPWSSKATVKSALALFLYNAKWMLSKLLKSLVKENVCLECFHLSVVKRRNEAARRFTDGDTGRLEITKKDKKKNRPTTN